MPLLRLREWPEVGWQVLALMRFPNDALLREGWQARETIRSICESNPQQTQLEVPVSLLRALLAAPGGPIVEREGVEAFTRGVLAGHVLLGMYLMSKFPQTGNPSLTRSIAALDRSFRGKRATGGKPIRAAATILRAHFNEFRNVAHLWAAVAFAKEFVIKEDTDSLFGSQSGINSFLQIAYSIQTFGLKHSMSAERSDVEFLLDPVATYSVPLAYAGWEPEFAKVPEAVLKMFPLPGKPGRRSKPASPR